MFGNAYQGKRVLITGHTGFKGSWLTVWLLRLGAQVAGYALAPPTDPSLFDSCRLEERIEHNEADVRDRERLRTAVAAWRPEFIFHLAAQPLVRDSYTMPVETYEVNVMGTINLLEAIRLERHSCSVVIVSTDKCYQNREWEYGYREIDPLGGHDPYSASKAAMEIAVASYRMSFFTAEQAESRRVGVATVRAGNVIGGGDWSSDRIVPDAIRALLKGESVVVRNPDSVRPWQHVLEPLAGYLWLGTRLAAEEGEVAGAWNFGPLESDTYRVADLAQAVVAAWGSGAWRTQEMDDSRHEAGRLKLCIDKAQTFLGWQPVWDFGASVSRTVHWYQNTEEQQTVPEAAYNACVEDIERYESAARTKGVRWAQ